MLIVLLTFKVASRGLYLLPRTQCLSCSALDAGEPLDAVGGGGGWWEADSSLCLSHVVRHKVCLLSEYMMDGWMDGWVNGCMEGWMVDGWVKGLMDGWMHGWMEG